VRPIAGIVAISLLVANSAIPGGTVRAAGSAGWQAAEQTAQILSAHEGHTEFVGLVNFYRTYVTTCKSPECVGIAVSLTRTSQNIAQDEFRALIAKLYLEIVAEQIAQYKNPLQNPKLAAEVNRLEAAQQAARNEYDLAQRSVALHQNALNNLALELEACEARCPRDPHDGAMAAPPGGGPPYRRYVTVCPSRPECREIAQELSGVSGELSVLEEQRREALAKLTSLRRSFLDGTLTADDRRKRSEAQEELRDLDNRILSVQQRFQSLMDALKTCEAECPSDSTPAKLSTARSTLGLKLAVGTLVVGGVAALATRGGDSDPGTTPATPNPPNPPAFEPPGNYQVVITFSGGNPAHLSFVALGPNGLLTLARNSPVRITSSNVANWVPVSGEYDDATNRFSLTGNGTVAGVANVSVRFEGSLTTAGQMTGSYTMGAGGELPGGQPVVYAVTGQKQ
jgi:hypothetical protein